MIPSHILSLIPPMNDTITSIIKSINKILEARWSQKQLAKGKWFEIKTGWDPEALRDLLGRFREAGWVVNRHVEITSPGTTKAYLVFIHPNYLKK